MHVTADWLLILYTLAGPGAWVGMFYGLWLARARMGRLRGPTPDLPKVPPSVTVIVPAKDEAEHIRACVEGLLSQDYPDYQVRVVDDRSTDGTGKILDDLAAGRAGDSSGRSRSLQVVHVDRLPTGWLGKCHALHVATRDVDSDWLLFVDSDVSIEADALRRAVAHAVARGYDAVSIITRLDGRTFWERLMIPVCGAAWATMFFISWTNDDNRKTNAVANGQFFLIRRSAYEAAGGHEGVKLEIVEDVELMRRLKVQGARCRLYIGTHLAATRMHATLAELRSGWGRIFAGSARYRRWRIYGAIAFSVISGLSVYPMLAVGGWRWGAAGDPRWLIAAGAHWGLMTAFLLHLYRSTRVAGWQALIPVVSFPVLLRLLLDGLRRCRDRRFVWRGTEVRT